MSEARVDRLDRLEDDVREIKATLKQLEPLIVRIDERLNVTLPHLATKAELADLRSEMTAGLGELRTGLADKPGRGYLWGVMGAMVGAQAVALAAAALIFSIIQMRSPAAPAPHASAASAAIVLAETVSESTAFDWDRYHDARLLAARRTALPPDEPRVSRSVTSSP